MVCASGTSSSPEAAAKPAMTSSGVAHHWPRITTGTGAAGRDADEASLISRKGGTDEWRPDLHHRLADGPCPRIQPRLGSNEPRAEDITDLPDRPGRVRPNRKITFGRDAQPDRRDHEHPIRHHHGGPSLTSRGAQGRRPTRSR